MASGALAESLWLLVFDNAEDFSSIKKFWPANVRGAIIVTSQNPLMAHSTKSEIYLQPFAPKEGCSPIQSYLKRGGSEQEPATQLSVSLGGLVYLWRLLILQATSLNHSARSIKYAKALLEFISFLDPDQVPVEMFVGSGSEVPRKHWQYWSRDR